VADFYWEIFGLKFKKAQMFYSIFKQMQGILDASNTTLDEVSYCNFLPYRGRGNKYPSIKRDMSHIIPNCRDEFVTPALEFLKPSLGVAFGNK